MIGGGVLAYTLLGIEHEERSGRCSFLILDPHYTGGEEVKKVHAGGWVGGWGRLGLACPARLCSAARTCTRFAGRPVGALPASTAAGTGHPCRPLPPIPSPPIPPVSPASLARAGQWVAWKQPGDKAAAGGDLFVASSFYNLLCPQRPATV